MWDVDSLSELWSLRGDSESRRYRFFLGVLLFVLMWRCGWVLVLDGRFGLAPSSSEPDNLRLLAFPHDENPMAFTALALKLTKINTKRIKTWANVRYLPDTPVMILIFFFSTTRRDDTGQFFDIRSNENLQQKPNHSLRKLLIKTLESESRPTHVFVVPWTSESHVDALRQSAAELLSRGSKTEFSPLIDCSNAVKTSTYSEHSLLASTGNHIALAQSLRFKWTDVGEILTTTGKFLRRRKNLHGVGRIYPCRDIVSNFLVMMRSAVFSRLNLKWRVLNI